jgi:hypothetical protein
MTPFQFRFQPRLGFYHALLSVCTVLKDAERLGSPLAINIYDICNTFGPLIFILRLYLSY